MASRSRSPSTSLLHTWQPNVAGGILIVTAVDAEAQAIGEIPGATVIAGGIGRAAAASATTRAILQDGPFDAVINAGVAGALPGGGLEIGDVVVASSCVYAEEGVMTPWGFESIETLGFRLGDFDGNSVPVDAALLELLSSLFATAPIATVATCSGTDALAAEIAERTKAVAEAMEGAAVVHAARLLDAAAIEVRTISNTTGDRDKQQWDLPRGLTALHDAIAVAMDLPWT